MAGLQQAIEELNADQEKLQDENNMFSEQNYYLESRIRGYENKALVDPRNMINFPSNLRKNMRKLFENMEQKHEIRYVKSLIDPFHPES